MDRKERGTRAYAAALLSIADAEGVLAQVQDELFHFSRALEQNGELREALTDIGIPSDRKRAIIDDLLSEKATVHTRSIVGLIVDQGKTREMGAIADDLAQLAAERGQGAVAEVRVATDLSDDQKARLTEALSKATGKNVDLKVVKDPSIVGGVVARVGDRVIDGSVRRRLALARERISET